MAVRKETIQRQFNEALAPVLEPGEQVQAGCYAVSGPNPMLSQGLLGLIGMFIFNMRWYYVAVTDRRVIFMKASLLTSRPTGLGWTDPRSSVSLSDVQLTAAVWGHFRYASASKQAPFRLNVHRFWLDQGREIVSVLGHTGAPPMPPTPPSA